MGIDHYSVSDRLIQAGSKVTVAREHGSIWHEMVEEKLATKQDLREAMLQLKIFMLSNTLATIGILSAIKYFG